MKPNVVAQGSGSTIISAYSGQVSSGSGTSFSSPITAGMVACLWQAHTDKKNTEIMEAIEQSGTLASNPNFELGYGIPDYMLAHDIVTNSGFEYAVNNPINVFPNPFKDVITIKMDVKATTPIHAVLVDITGKIIFETELDGKSDYYELTGLNEIPAGIYFIKIYEGNNSFIQKIIK
jgi:subtilisin family serine protease